MFNSETNAKHRALIAQVLCDVPGSSDSGFARAVGDLCRALGTDPTSPGFLPDAYRINHETSEIEIYEVEVRHALPPVKIAQLGDFWEWWDSEGEHDWLPVLIVVSRYGFHQRIDLQHALYRTGPFAD